MKRRWRDGRGGDDYSREAINRGTAIIRGNTVNTSTMSLKNWDAI